MNTKTPAFAAPREVTDPKDCIFYHVMEIPGHGVTKGQWDLRGQEATYLGNVDLRGKRVFEVGTASGFLCFAMECMGAEVTAYDLSEEHDWDVVPYWNQDFSAQIAHRREVIRKLNNSWWFAHKAYDSKARVMYGAVYDIPADLGPFEVCTFGSILLHLRDPFRALQSALRHVTETVIITDLMIPMSDKERALTDKRNLIAFVPDAEKGAPWDTWWKLSPEVVAEFVKVLGFTEVKTTFHEQLCTANKRRAQMKLYTIVARRPPAANPLSNAAR